MMWTKWMTNDWGSKEDGGLKRTNEPTEGREIITMIVWNERQNNKIKSEDKRLLI